MTQESCSCSKGTLLFTSKCFKLAKIIYVTVSTAASTIFVFKYFDRFKICVGFSEYKEQMYHRKTNWLFYCPCIPFVSKHHNKEKVVVKSIICLNGYLHSTSGTRPVVVLTSHWAFNEIDSNE